MAKSRNGERYAIGIAVGVPDGMGGTKSYQVFNDASINKFSLDIPLNGLPTGKATLVGPANISFPVSGAYGFLGLGSISGMLNDQFPIYITETNNRQLASGNVIVMDISFVMGNADMHAVMPATAITGTSLEAISELMNIAGIGGVSLISSASDADIMTWRLVEGTFAEHMTDIVEHSTIPGDVMYWAFNDMARILNVGSFNSSYDSPVKYCMVNTSNAIQPTGAACYTTKGSEVMVWPYSTYSPRDLGGTLRGERKPNIIMDNTGPDGTKDAGRCNDRSWFNLVMENGAKPVFVDGPGAYGPLKLVKPYPLNTHKMYSIAPLIRDYLMSGFTRMVQTEIYNQPGPPVGSCVYFCASSPDSKMGNFIPDPRFTARYIVTHKRITKDATTSTGLLGTTRHTQSSELVSEFTMVSRNDYNQELSYEYDTVVNLYKTISENMKTATEKK